MITAPVRSPIGPCWARSAGRLFRSAVATSATPSGSQRSAPRDTSPGTRTVTAPPVREERKAGRRIRTESRMSGRSARTHSDARHSSMTRAGDSGSSQRRVVPLAASSTIRSHPLPRCGTSVDRAWLMIRWTTSESPITHDVTGPSKRSSIPPAAAVAHANTAANSMPTRSTGDRGDCDRVMGRGRLGGVPGAPRGLVAGAPCAAPDQLCPRNRPVPPGGRLCPAPGQDAQSHQPVPAPAPLPLAPATRRAPRG